MVTDAKSEAHLNGWSDEHEVKSCRTIFNTLSGVEAADNRNSWDNFKHLLSDETSLPDASGNEMPGDKESAKVTLTVSVEDTGIGIPLQAQDRVFTPFMQADSSTSRNYGGTGIGLSISKCLVELMGGQINFISRPHVGSTFTFTVVLKRCKGSAIDEAKRALPEPLPISFRGMKSILIDERPVRGAVTKYHLQRLGVTVDIASTMKAAFNAKAGQNGCTR